MSNLIVKDFIFPPLNNHNYLVLDPESKEAVLFDCSVPNDDVVKFVESQGAILKMVLLTHGHFDHVMGVNYFWEKHHIPTYVHENDLPLLQEINAYTYFAHMDKVVEIPKVDGTFNGSTVFKLGNHSIRILETPGHTQGCCCFLMDDILISGDTLFQGAYGRTDLPTSNAETMQRSLKRLFRELVDNVRVYPGHGHPTTIGAERGLYEAEN